MDKIVIYVPNRYQSQLSALIYAIGFANEEEITRTVENNFGTIVDIKDPAKSLYDYRYSCDHSFRMVKLRGNGTASDPIVASIRKELFATNSYATAPLTYKRIDIVSSDAKMLDTHMTDVLSAYFGYPLKNETSYLVKYPNTSPEALVDNLMETIPDIFESKGDDLVLPVFVIHTLDVEYINNLKKAYEGVCKRLINSRMHTANIVYVAPENYKGERDMFEVAKKHYTEFTKPKDKEYSIIPITSYAEYLDIRVL